MTRSTAPSEIRTRWILSITWAAFGSAARPNAFRPFAGTKNSSHRNSSGTVTNRKMPTIARSAREVRRPVGNDSRKAANPAPQRSVNQSPAV